MGRINKRKLSYYVNRLYRAELKRYKEKLDSDLFSVLALFDEAKKKERVSLTSSQKEVIIRKYNGRCAICGERYKGYGFHFHHIDGDPSNTTLRNIVFLCSKCHDLVHKMARAKLKDYKVREKRRARGVDIEFDITGFKPSEFDLSLFFGNSRKRRRRRKKSDEDLSGFWA